MKADLCVELAPNNSFLGLSSLYVISPSSLPVDMFLSASECERFTAGFVFCHTLWVNLPLDYSNAILVSFYFLLETGMFFLRE